MDDLEGIGTAAASGTEALLGGKYRVLRPLGRGGMGDVFLADHVALGRRCAIKMLPAPRLSDVDALARFRREAANAATFVHPNIAMIFDFGDDTGRPFLAMEYVDGRSLGEEVIAVGALPLPRVVELIVQIARALDAAHAAGIVHRDLKPSNVMLTTDQDGREIVKLVDFGISRRLGSPEQVITALESVMGTAGFIAPEQYVSAHDDALVDIYALGVLTAYLLIGRMPENTPGFALDISHVPQAAGWKPDIRPVVARALTADRNARWPRAGKFAEALVEATGGSANKRSLDASAPLALETLTAPFDRAVRTDLNPPVRVVATLPSTGFWRRPSVIGSAVIVLMALLYVGITWSSKDNADKDGQSATLPSAGTSVPPQSPSLPTQTGSADAPHGWITTITKSAAGKEFTVRHPDNWIARQALDERPPLEVGYRGVTLSLPAGTLLLLLPDSLGEVAIGLEEFADSRLKADEFAADWVRTRAGGSLTLGLVRPVGDGFQVPLRGAVSRTESAGSLHMVLHPHDGRISVLWRAFFGDPVASAPAVSVMESVRVQNL